jgi:NodT family efflux transporter outer membrane factor (OMF) lipoprotein
MLYRFFALLALVIFSGCAGVYKGVDGSGLDAVKIPSEFTVTSGAGDYGGDWWTVFKDSELNSLIDKVFANNYQIAGSYDGVRALYAALGVTMSDRLPSVSAGATASEKYSADARGVRQWRDSYGISLTASYEADVWGRLRSATEAGRQEILAGRYSLETLHMTMAAETADRFFLYKYLSSLLKIQKEQLELRQKQVSALEMMYSSGVGALEQIYVKQTAIANLMAEITQTMKSMQDAKMQLAVLAGLSDPAQVEISDEYALYVPYLPDVIPSDVVQKRPDIKTAYANVARADMVVAQAAAARYPKLSFTADAGYSSDDISRLVSPENFVSALIANLALPIFNAGELKNQQKKQEHLLAQQINTYYSQIISALKEVSISLTDNMQKEAALKLASEKVTIEENRLKIAGMKYEMGVSDYSAVLDNKISLLSGWANELNARRLLISARIELARASGGTWAESRVENRLADAENGRIK